MATAPSVDNYFIGKGKVYMKLEGESSWRDVGNVPTFEFTPNFETLKHESSREGTKVTDRNVVTSKSGTLRLVLDEWDPENLKLAFLGDLSTNSEGLDVIEIFSRNSIAGAVRLEGTNEVGPRFEVILNRVEFTPSNNLNLITDEFGTIELTGECTAVNGSFGTVTKKGEQTEASTE